MALRNYLIIIIIILALVYYFFFFNTKVALPLDDLKITYPSDLQEVSGIITVRGEASDKYDKIYYRIDLDDWKEANGISKWSFILDTTKLSKDLHVIYIKAGEKTKAVRIIID